ncbi:MAG: MFS transporter [Chloroflexi bacterium]|nr:MFS transporter [Chloroflexota bacterium]BCY17758.1 MFS transporter [Leptolinea sp. HRD-7]
MFKQTENFARRVGFSVKQTFIALRHPNYRLWFYGQLVSLVGTWMQNTAQGFLIYQLTNSPAFLGYVAFASGLPSWLFTLYGGVVADRISRRKLIIITQASMMILAFIQAALVFTRFIQPWHILVLAFLLGIATAFDAPARQSFVVELVDREDLTNAIALNSTMFNMATVVGPAVAGFAYALVGPAWCFTINGISFIAVITALALMKLPEWSMKTASGTILARINEGLDYIRNNQVIIGIISMVGIVGAFGSGIFTLTPAWSVEVLRGDASTNGLMLSARGLGSMIGGLFIAWLSRYKVRGKSFAAGGLLLPVVIAGFAIMTNIPSSLLFLCLVGFFFMLVINNANALIQTAVPDHLRGRVMSIYVLVFFGAQPLGSLLAGELAETINESMTVLIFAALLLLCSIIVFLRVPSLKKLH